MEENLYSEEEAKEIFEDYEADFWVEMQKSGLI
jgi:hypothetical protein